MKRCVCKTVNCTVRRVTIPVGTELSYCRLPGDLFLLIYNGKSIGPIGAKVFYTYFRTKGRQE